MPDQRHQLDSVIEIVTPENIAFRYELAGPFRRFPAFSVDLMVRLAAALGAVFLLWFGQLFVGAASWGVVLVFWFLLEWFYGGLFETIWNGQTPGKRMMGLRVVSIDGHPISGLQAVMRNLLRGADMMPLFPLFVLDEAFTGVAIPTFMIGFVCMALNPRFQRLGDLVCGTMVIVEERTWSFGVAQLDDPRVQELAERIPARFQFSRQLNRALTTYVERRRFFSVPRREEIAKHLARPLIPLLELPADTSHDLLLCAMYHRSFIADMGAASATTEANPVPSVPASPVAASTETIA
ncbi:MAG: RDD family protein [Planctomycetota bacterium]